MEFPLTVETTADSESTTYTLAVGTFSETYDFAVAAGAETDASFTLTADSVATVLSDVEFTLQRELPDGTFEDVASTSGGGALDLLSLTVLGDNQVQVTADDLPPGNYRVVYEGGGLLSLGITLTLDVEFQTTTVDGDPVSGNVLANDVDAGEAVLEIDTGDGNFVAVTNGLVIEGEYGSLLINADGSYTYTPNDEAVGVGESEVFTYRLVNPDGTSDTATLTIDLVEGDTTSPDTTPPDAPTADVDDATGGVVSGTGEVGATITVYAPDGTTELGTGTVEADGTYSVTIPAQTDGEDLLVTATDAAGNESTPTTAEAPDLTPPAAPTADVDDGTGTLVTGTGEVGATITVYAPDGTTELGTGTVEADGTYSVTIPAQTDGEDLLVTATDAAGNESTPTTAEAPDLTLPAAPEAALETDTGVDGDGITSDGTVGISGLEDGASWEYSIDGGTSWVAGAGTSFELAAGEYAAGDVQVRQTDAAGNTGPSAQLGAVTVAVLLAVDDTATADLGARDSVTQAPVTDDNLQVLGLLDDGNATNSLAISVAEGTSGDVAIEVSQTSLLAVADAFNVEIYDSAGELIGVLTTGNDPLLGDVAGLGVLGVTSDNTLVANVTGLEPGDYTIVVRKGESTAGSLLDTDGNGLSLEELGEGGVVLGTENQALVLDSVETALNGEILPGIGLPLGTVVRNLLEPVLDTTTSLGAGELVEVLADGLNSLGLGASLDAVLGAVTEALLSNTLTVIQDTSVTATVTEHSFSAIGTPVTGNVIDPDAVASGEAGEDTAVPGTTVTQVENGAGEVQTLAGGSATIEGAYGTLVINADGSYSYTANGDSASIGLSDVFTYTISDGTNSVEATLTVEVAGEQVADDTAQAGIEYEYEVTAGDPIPDAVDYAWTGVLLGAPLGATGDLVSDSFIVAADTTQDVTLAVDAGSLLGVGGGVTVFVELLDTTSGTWSTYASYDGSQLLSLLGSGGTGDILVPDVPAGEYRVRADVNFGLVSVAGGVNIDVTSTVTHLDSFLVGQTFPAEGDLFANDLLGDVDPPLAISADGTTFTDVTSGTPVTVQGTYGALEVNADGTYTYTPNTAAHLTEPALDTFEYQVTLPSGEVEEGTLEVTVQPSGAGVPDADAAAFMSMFAADAIPLELADADGSETIAATGETGLPEFDLLEGQGTLEEVLDRYLGESGDDAPMPLATEPTGEIALVQTALDPVQDPLGYLGTDPRDDLDGSNVSVV
ncbi:BapA/Bap/LapF family large adhesin [Pelagerythrobacter aerophilus]|uniref:Bacterial Ig domain-containing protein n=1 Tax=Pelagerythrobacter aerophilus TaxID=2306995 RepID=A0A418NLR4_9SPHN|nr:BapA/Bap/LapF family large adhesin [Pelagerythrobacter aerophilus]RIV80797.1 hypothetical protein D2V04_02120 [Pelagerythrobacter aerophilus]